MNACSMPSPADLASTIYKALGVRFNDCIESAFCGDVRHDQQLRANGRQTQQRGSDLQAELPPSSEIHQAEAASLQHVNAA